MTAMGARLPVLSAPQLIKLLARAGFIPVAQRGSHIKIEGVRAGQRRFTTLPMHGSEDLPAGIIKAVLADLGISREELLQWIGSRRGKH